MNTEAKDIPIDQIEFVIKRERDEEKRKEVRASIADVGLKKPIQVRDRGRVGPDGKRYELIAGQGRTTMCQELGWKTIPALIVDAGREEFLTLFIIENTREDMTATQKGRIIREEMKRGKTLEEVAKKVHIKPEQARRYLAVLDKTATGIEAEIDRMGVNLAEALVKLPKPAQKIVIQVSRETAQPLKSVIEKAHEVQKKKGSEWGDASKMELRKVIKGTEEQLTRARKQLKTLRLHWALGPMNIQRLLKSPSARKKLKAEGVPIEAAEAAINKAEEVTIL